MCVAYSLRKMTAPMQKGATGKKLVLLNTFVGAVSSACASWCNTSLMRQAEVQSGIEVFSDESLKEEDKVGISKVAAKQAVQETALSRVCLSLGVCSMPFCIMSILSLNRNFNRLLTSSPKSKIIMELSCCITAISLGLPLAVAIFPPISQKEGSLCEDKFNKFEKLYFSKGL